MSVLEHEGGPTKLGGQAKAIVALVVVVAIVIPIILGFALVGGNPYFTQAPTVPAGTATTTGGSAAANTVILPQGASTGQDFSPGTLTVKSGTTITFMDQDGGAPHNVYFTNVPTGAANPNPSGGPPTLTKGDTYTVTLTTAGTYSYICQFHPGWMKATIVVTS